MTRSTWCALAVSVCASVLLLGAARLDPPQLFYRQHNLVSDGFVAADFLYATDFHNGRIEVLNSSFAPAKVHGPFHDPNLPAGFAPFGISNIGGSLYVTYAKQDADAHDNVDGAGLGFVNVFDLNG